MASDGAPTVSSFPTYAELTQTRGWTDHAADPVRIAHDPTVELHDPGLRRYTEGELLGAGGMGKVVLAHDARIGREVAVKQLHTGRELSREERARFLREARVQGQLEHPSIVPVYDMDSRSDGTTFFTMRRVLGRTLQQIIEELRQGSTRHTLRELLTAFGTVCLAIDYAHSRGVIHRDLKPANIMLGDFGEVYVLDWGVARLADDVEDAPKDDTGKLSATGELMGTLLYMAPEQMTSPAVGPAADVFALGAILFEILTLQRLRDANTLYLPANARASTRMPERRVPVELERICVRATETDIAARYPSARALHDDLKRYLEGDREDEQRRVLADRHGSEARAALARAESPTADYEHERGVAMRELVRALALDPTDDTHVATLARILEAPPRVVPAEVAEQTRLAEKEVVRRGAAGWVFSSLLWLLFLPLVLAMGLRRFDLLAFPLAAIVLASTISAIAWRKRITPLWMQYAVIIVAMLAMIGLTRMFGPFMLFPTMIATFTIVLQVHPQRSYRRWAMVLGSAAAVVPFALEVLGVLPESYRFADGLMSIVPQMHDLPRLESYFLLATSALASTLIPCLWISSVVQQLQQAQLQQRLQAWHFRRLADELIGKPAAG